MNTEAVAVLAIVLSISITLTGFAIVILLKAINDSLFHANELNRELLHLHPDHPSNPDSLLKQLQADDDSNDNDVPPMDRS